jgi:hypothetical protein
MPETTVKQMLDPAQVAREEGRIQGRLEMRDQLAQEVGALMARASNADIADAMWHLLRHLRGKSLT